MKILISLAAVSVLALSAAPAAAQHRGDNRHWNNDKDNHRGHQSNQSHRQRWSSGYRFGPSYSYTSYNSLPPTYVSQYHLSRRYRYVYNDGYIYQVDPTTYAVTRVIQALTGR
jgi:hypothetical protein